MGGLLQRVCGALQWCPHAMVAKGQFSIRCDFRQVVVLHPGDVPCLVQLYLKEHDIDASGLCYY